MPGGGDTVAMTSVVDGQCHRVTHDALALGIAEGHGVYEAMCGRRLMPAAMICADGPSCPRCGLVTHARRILPDLVLDPSVHRRRHRRPGWLRRTLTRRRTVASPAAPIQAGPRSTTGTCH